MITLYHCDGARSFRPLWMLEELGLAYELKMLPFPPRVFAKEYIAINPLGTIPFMIDGETKMTESSGICHYLGTRHGPTPLVVGVDESGLWRVPELDVFQRCHADLSADAGAPLQPSSSPRSGAIRRSRATMPSGSWAGCGRWRPRPAMRRRWSPAGSRRPTSSIGYALRLAENIGLAKDFGPNVAAYWARLQAARRLSARGRRRNARPARAEGRARGPEELAARYCQTG